MQIFLGKTLDFWASAGYNSKAVANAAIAQPVERILGKDEVASSNLASSSKKEPTPFGVGSFFVDARFEPLNAARMSAARCGWTQRNLYFLPQRARNATKSG